MKHNQTFSIDSEISELLYQWKIQSHKSQSEIICELIKNNYPKSITNQLNQERK